MQDCMRFCLARATTGEDRLIWRLLSYTNLTYVKCLFVVMVVWGHLSSRNIFGAGTHMMYDNDDDDE